MCAYIYIYIYIEHADVFSSLRPTEARTSTNFQELPGAGQPRSALGSWLLRIEWRGRPQRRVPCYIFFWKGVEDARAQSSMNPGMKVARPKKNLWASLQSVQLKHTAIYFDTFAAMGAPPPPGALLGAHP